MNFMFIRARYNYIQLIILQRIEGKARFLYSLPFPPSSNGMKWYAVILILIAIPADANFLNGYALNGSVLVGYVLKIRIGGICIGGIRLRFLLMHTFWMDTFAMDTYSMDTYWDTFGRDTFDTNGYVWDMYDVLDMYGICVVIGGIRITTFWMDTHCMDTYWWDTYGWDTFGMDMCGICAMCWICVGYVWWIRLEWICVGYVWCAGYVWDMCGVRYANNLLKNPATKRLSAFWCWQGKIWHLRYTCSLSIIGWIYPPPLEIKHRYQTWPFF